jgi:hypothetical protein
MDDTDPMATDKLIESIEVQIALARMMPAVFSRQTIEVIAKLVALHKADPTNQIIKLSKGIGKIYP